MDEIFPCEASGYKCTYSTFAIPLLGICYYICIYSAMDVVVVREFAPPLDSITYLSTVQQYHS